MESIPPDPLRAIRNQAAEAVSRVDLTSEEGQAVARVALELEHDTQVVEARRAAAREDLRARRADARASTAYEWTVIGMLLLLAGVTAGVVLWILVWSGMQRGAQAGSVSVALSGFGTLAWMMLRRADARRAARTPDPNEQDEADEPPAEEEAAGEGNEAAQHGVLRWLRDRLG